MTAREANADLLAEITALRDRIAEQGRRIAGLQGELAQASHREAATSEILRIISSSPNDVQPVFDAIVTSATRLLRGYSGSLYRLAGDQIELVALTSTDAIGDTALKAAYPRSVDSDDLNAQAIRRRVPLNIADAQTDPRLPEITHAYARARGFQSVGVVPMLRHDEAIGAIGVGRRDPGGFTDDEIALLKTFADQAVIAIENVRLFKELQASNRELTTALDTQTATSDILRVISRSQTDVQPVFDTIVRNAVRLCDAIYGLVYRSDGEHVYLAAHHNFTPQQLGEWQQTFPRPINDSGASVHVIRTGVVLRVADVEIQRDSPISEKGRALLRSQNARSVLIVPMFRQNEVIG